MKQIEKLHPIVYLSDESEITHALQIQVAINSGKMVMTKDDNLIEDFYKIYRHSYSDTLLEFTKWFPNVSFQEIDRSAVEKLCLQYQELIAKSSEYKPVKLKGSDWAYKGFLYRAHGYFTDEEVELLILEDFDSESRYFEKLKAKFNEPDSSEIAYERPRIPENIRIEVWRRDGGKCARCGSRERLEYDHIVPISKGGSNTGRNIELLCEKCNRSKSNNIA